MSCPQDHREDDNIQHSVSTRGSKVTSERVALLVISALLAAAVIAVCRLADANIMTEHGFQRLKDEHEALKRNLSDNTCLKCGAGWEPFGEKCYYFSTLKSSWSQSRDECQNQGADLVKIDSRDEQVFLDKELIDKMEEAEDKFWIGLTDSEEEGEWKWVDGSPLDQSLTFWSRNEPDNWRGNDEKGEDCARMGERGGAEEHKIWFDQGCENSNKHICEKSSVKGKHKCE